jgi:hypothetical protein
MHFKTKTLTLVAALVAVMAGTAHADWPYSYRNVYTRPVRVYTSYPVYDSNYYKYNDRNVYKSNHSSYSRYPSSEAYRSYYNLSNGYNDGYYYNNNGYYNNGYYPNGYYSNGYYYDRPGLQIGPVRINF